MKLADVADRMGAQTKAARRTGASGLSMSVSEDRKRQRSHRRSVGGRAGGEGGIRTLEAGYPTWRFSKPLH
jgi:hypothetical protein